MNKTIEKLLKDEKITQEEFDVLFKNTEHKEGFLKAFNKVIQIFKEEDCLHFDYISFPDITELSDFYSYIISILGTRCSKNLREIVFGNCNFYSEISIKEINIKHHLHFGEANFHKKVNFNKSVFEKRIDFLETKFYFDVTFGGVKFEDEAHFWNTKAYKSIGFYSMTCSKIISMKKLSFNKIDIDNAQFTEANFLSLKGLDENKNEVIVNKNNFANKESARLIKAHFEKQGNITEANKYFVIEQEKYIDELKNKKNITEGGKWTKLMPLYLNKYVSNFGTDWVRATLILMLWGFVSLFLFMSYKYTLFTYPNEFYMAGEWNKSNLFHTVVLFAIFISIYFVNFNFPKIQNCERKVILACLRFLRKYIKRKSKLYRHLIKIRPLLFSVVAVSFIIWQYDSNLFNLISKLINPINAFKDDDTFKGYEAFGVFIRVVSAAIIYQIIVAFRQFTRRA